MIRRCPHFLKFENYIIKVSFSQSHVCISIVSVKVKLETAQNYGPIEKILAERNKIIIRNKKARIPRRNELIQMNSIESPATLIKSDNRQQAAQLEPFENTYRE